MPRITAFPKAHTHAACRDGTIKLSERRALGGDLRSVDGYEFHEGFFELQDGEIGTAFNHGDAIFTGLERVGFDSWITIEGGVNGIDQWQGRVDALKRKFAVYRS